MKILRGDNGAALVTALMLTSISLVIALALLYTVSAGTKISASQKRYRSALAAAHGGVELVTREIVPRLLRLEPQSVLQDEFALINLKLPGQNCLRQKLTSATGAWDACSAAQASADPAQAPDLSFTLGGALPADPSYNVTAKIVDTVPGNSDTTGFDQLEQGSSVAGADEGIRPQHVPGIYHIAVQGVGGDPREKACLSLLYAY